MILGSVATRLQNLAADGRMPPTLAEMANQLRHIRNFGAHADTSYQVTERDIPVLLDFLDAILEYLYIARDKLAQVQKKLDRARQRAMPPVNVVPGNLPPERLDEPSDGQPG
jgi:hypothetical protein